MYFTFFPLFLYSGEKDAGDKKEKDKKKGEQCVKFQSAIDFNGSPGSSRLANLYIHIFTLLFKLRLLLVLLLRYFPNCFFVLMISFNKKNVR